jgi:hypothetical protein
MAKVNGYEVINVDELTVHRTVNKFAQDDGSTVYQNGLGKTWMLGEVIPPDEVSEDIKEALDDKEGSLYESIKEKLKPVSDDPGEDAAARLGIPFAGFEDMDTEDLVRAMSVLPSATIQRIKDYESMSDDPRTEIVDYVIGFGEHPDARQLADPEVNEDVDETKAVRRLQTREVPDDGPVIHGEGITGGASVGPQKGYGVTKDAEEDPDAPKKANIGGAARKAGQRRGRRDRQPQPKGGTPKDEGGSSLESTNDE